MRIEFRRDFVLALCGADDHAVLLEALLVVQEVADVNGARTEEPVAACSASCSDTGNGNFQRLAVEYRDDPADRSNETRAIEAGPSHGARPGKIVHRARKDATEDLLGSSSQLDLFGRQVLALGCLDQIQIADVNALLLSEALRGPCRRADGIVRHGLGRAGHFRLDVRLLNRQSANPGSQAPRRTEGLDRYPIREALGSQQLFNIRAKFLFGFWEHPSGDLFAADFEK